LIRERRRKESELLLRFGKERDFDNLIWMTLEYEKLWKKKGEGLIENELSS
jgi:hypothetical protein